MPEGDWRETEMKSCDSLNQSTDKHRQYRIPTSNLPSIKEASVHGVPLTVVPTIVSLRVNTLSQCLLYPAMGDLLSHPIYLALLRAVFIFSIFITSIILLFLVDLIDTFGFKPLMLFLLLLFPLILFHQIV